MLTLKINGKEIIAEKDTIFNVASKNGIEIPNLCYDKRLFPFGACRVCIVEDKKRGIIPSCHTPIDDGMEIETNSENVIKHRKVIFELLLANHPLDCMTCEKSGDCKFEKYCYEYGVKDTRFKGRKREFEILSENQFFIRDYNKCIYCGLCVRVCNEIQFNYVYEFANKGFNTEIYPYPKKMEESNCVFCGNCVNVCPTGSLTEKQRIGKGREWEFKKVKTICGYCGVGCNIHLYIKDNRIVKVVPLRSVVNDGVLCVKGKFGYEFVQSEERLRTPLIKKDGKFFEISWEDALNLIAEKFKQYKPNELAFLSSGKCTNEENYLLQKFARILGTNNIDHCARLCHAPSVVSLNIALGSGAMTNSLEEIKNSDVIIVSGNNTTETHPITALKIKKAVKNGAKLFVVEPREIELCNFAYKHLKQKIGTDVAWLNAVANVIVNENLENKEFIEKRTEGYEEFKKVIEKYSPEYAEKITGIKADDIRDLARSYANAKRGMIFWGMGITQHTTGVDNVLSITNLALLTGNIGKESSGLYPLRGQNNVQGACDMGALPDVFSGYQGINNENARKKFEEFWKVKLNEKVGLSSTEMADGILNGKIKFMYIMGENPILTHPDANHFEKALKKLEFLVVQDIFLTETGKLANIVLPATSFAEKDGTFTNTERRVQRIRKALSIAGKEDWQIIQEIANKLGINFNYKNSEEIFNEIALLTPSYAGITYERIEQEGIQWPCPDSFHEGTKFLHEQQFTRGKGKFFGREFIEPIEKVSKDYPLLLTTGRVLYHYHAVISRKVKALNEFYKEQIIEINPKTAKKLKIKNGEIVKVISERGEVLAKAILTNKVKEGEVFSTFHFEEANINLLTINALDKIAKIPEYKVSAVRIEKVK